MLVVYEQMIKGRVFVIRLFAYTDAEELDIRFKACRVTGFIRFLESK